MFKKKIIASALVWSLFLGSFGNIFANSDQLAVEKKICENIEKLKGFKIVDNNFYYSFGEENARDLDYSYFKNLEKKDFYSAISEWWPYWRTFEIFLLNDDSYILDYEKWYNKNFYILKNWKPLCENLENNNWNSGNQNWNSWNQNSSSQNSSNQSSSWNSWSTPASSSNITIKNDERVIGSENTVKTVKSEDKNENKKEDLKSKTFTENEKNDVKDLVSNIIKKYSQSKDTLDRIYKALTTREDIKKMAENNPRIKFVIEEFTKQYIIFSVWR